MLASMSPRLVGRGDINHLDQNELLVVASMGSRLVGHGDQPPILSTCRGFNGASGDLARGLIALS